MARTSKSNSNLLLLSSLTFVLVATSALSMNKVNEPPKKVEVIDKETNQRIRTFAPIPVLGAQSESLPPELSSSSIIAIDIDSGVTLLEKNPDEELFPASTTKMLTALVVLDLYQLQDEVTVGGMSVVGQKMGLIEGEVLTVNSLLEGMLIYSANDAAEALAAHHPEGRAAFIDAMNAKAQELHLMSSHFTNPTGLEDWQHVSTARDMATIAKAAMNNPIFASIVSTQKTTIQSVDGTKSHTVRNINKLLGSIEGVIGIKTGWTEHAKENLVTYVERDGKRVVISLLASDDRFGETKALIDWIYGSYEWEEVVLP
jgi:serine-type D-Ala-D-Ala carboxypeptidase (penicillin-binding protein 5/6)